ncbi:uncharacterized protein M6B38_280150 [Iris pallida]|uniref:Uncharacterized protein n=1 Tax=Iris pallida TaxID=29817 RepID=A0AAX6HY30_IRIPA|nr:uncharacterized protein M6B38_280150 [Iris pallida]
MDFHALPRRTLQSLCKKNGVAANLSNVAMAESLASLPKVEGLDEEAAATASPPRTPTTNAKPAPLRPPNPPRSCRRSSVLPLLKDESFSKKKWVGIETAPLSACVGSKKKRSVAALLFPCSERGVIDEMPVRKEAHRGPKREAFLSDELRARGGGTGVRDDEVRNDVKEEAASVLTRETGECFNESVVLPSSAESVEEQCLKSAVFVSQPREGSGDMDAEMMGDEENESVVLPSSAELVEEQCLKNAVFVSQPREGSGDKDAKMMGDEEEDAGNGMSFCLDEAVGLPNHAESEEEQGLKNVGFVSDDMEEGEEENHTRASEDCLDEAVAIREDQGLEDAVVFASEDMAIGGEGSEDKDADTLEDEKGGEEANGETFYAQDETTRRGTDSISSSPQLEEEEGLRNLDSVSEDKEEGEEVNLNRMSGDCLDEAVVILEDQCLNNVVFASEEMAVRGEGIEDRDADMLEEEKGGEEANEESFCGQSDLNCLDDAVRVLCSHPSVCMLKGQEEELLQGSSLGGIESGEQEDGLKDDGVHHDLGEVEERGLKNADISSAELCASGERSENKGKKENGESLSGKNDVTCANGGCLYESVRLQSSQELVTTVKDQENVFLQSPSSGCLGSDRQKQGLKDGVHHVLMGEVDKQGLKDAEFESEEMLVSGERGEDMDAEVMKDNKGEAWTDSRAIQTGATDLENNVGKGELPAIGDQISPLGSEAKNPISASDDCECKAVSVLKDQECGLLQQVLRGEMEKQVIELRMQNKLNETCEMPVMPTVNEDIDAESRSSIAIQVNIADYAASNQITPLDLDANGGTTNPHTDSISTIGEDNSTIPEYEKDVNYPIPATEDLHQKSPPTSKTIDSSCCPDLIEKGNNFSSSPLVTATFLEKEVAQSSSPQVVRQIGNEPCSGSVEPSYKPSEVGEEEGIQQSTITNSIKESNSGVRVPAVHSDNTVLEKGEGEKREFVECTDLDKDTKEAMKLEGASKKRSAKKADMSSLSLRKLKVLYKQNKQVEKLEIKSKLDSENESAEMMMKDEQSAEKTGLGGLSLRRLKLMYRQKVANG